MLLALTEIAQELQISITVAHLNHGIRGRAADADEKWVRALAERLGLPCIARKVSLRNSKLRGRGESLEMAARRVRYDFLARAARQVRASCIVTAHTADDQAETIILRLLRGTGLRGLRGIHEVRDDGVIRPLLSCTKRTIVSWMEAQGLTHREDSSNTDSRYTRNWVRHTIMPLLAQREPGVCQTLASLARDIEETFSLCDAAVNKWRDDFVVTTHSNGFTVKKVGVGAGFLAREALGRVLAEHGIAMTREHLQRLTSGILRTGSTILLPGKWECRVEKDVLAIGRQGDPTAIIPCRDLSIPGATECGAVTIHSQILSTDHVRGAFDNESRTVFLDANVTGVDLTYRPWKRDDVFIPLGASQPREIGRYLKNQGISRFGRTTVGIVARKGSRDVVWIPGVQIGEGFRLTPSSSSVLRLSQVRADVATLSE